MFTRYVLLAQAALEMAPEKERPAVLKQISAFRAEKEAARREAKLSAELEKTFAVTVSSFEGPAPFGAEAPPGVSAGPTGGADPAKVRRLLDSLQVT